MKTIIPGEQPTAELHQLLLGAIGPRPIAWASTMDENGNPNLSPYSFFNVFSANPPILIFSPARRVRDNSIKHTLQNAEATKEVVINVVSFDLVEQMSLSSTEYPQYVNEFEKAGVTPMVSETVRPFRVKESPVHFECKVREIVALGTEGGAGNLVICEILRMHINPNILDEKGRINPNKIDLVARMGGDYYTRANGSAIFEVAKPLRTMGIGVNAIPPRIRNSYVLTGNDLGKLGNVERLPSREEIEKMRTHSEVDQIFSEAIDGDELRERLHELAHGALEQNLVMDAWAILLTDKLNQL